VGGQALKVAATRRYSRDEWHRAWSRFATAFHARFPGVRVALVPPVADKATFGDMDVVMDGEAMPDNWHGEVMKLFNAVESNVSLNVDSRVARGSAGFLTSELLNRPFSFALDDLQVDLCPVASDTMDFTLGYLGYGDLGALMGPVYRKLGARYGMRGLTLLPLDRQGNEMRHHPVTLSLDHATALRVAGYSPERFAQGFATLEEVYHYVASSPFFSSTLYLEGKRENAKTRERDRKRPGHRQFAEWVAAHRDSLPEGCPMSPATARERLLALFPGADEACRQVVDSLDAQQRRRKRFSGALLREVTGLEGAALGKFAEHARLTFSTPAAFEAFLADLDDQQLRHWVAGTFQQYREPGVTAS
jgi:hypothetical protein